MIDQFLLLLTKPNKNVKNPVLLIEDQVDQMETTPYEEAITLLHKAMIYLSAIISQTNDVPTNNIDINYENRLAKHRFKITTDSNKKLKASKNVLWPEKKKTPNDGK